MDIGQIAFPGKTMSTCTPRSAARFKAVMSAGSGRKYGVTICTEVCASASAASSVQRNLSKSASGPSVMTRAMTCRIRFEFRKPDFAVQHLAGGERPIVGERLLQSRHHRAFDAKMQVLNGAFGVARPSTLPWRMFMPPVKAVWPSTTRILR